MKTLVALDLETTGLNPDIDAIIEIGVVRFRGPRLDAEWSTLVNPGRPLSREIVNLTGIDDAMLANAPRLTQVLADLGDFVGDHPILGHNLRFDLDFLQPKGLFKYNLSVDTYDLASVLLPNAGSYRLGALASALGVLTLNAHRALDDAHTTRDVFLRLYSDTLELPFPLLEEIVRLGADIEWGAGWLFEEALNERLAESTPEGSRIQPFQIPWKRKADKIEPLTSSSNPQPLDPEELGALLEPSGPFERAFPDYEHRPQQVKMLTAIAEALSKGDHLLVEAGTGTGKSMAYLIPAFAWAMHNGERVVISTNTINLQEQLVFKDVPDLRKALEADYRVAVLKGRSNYLCPRHLSAMIQLGPRSADEMRVLAKILVWLERGGAGDRGEINLLGPNENGVWSRLASESGDCTLETCLVQMSGLCPYYQAHRDAENAHVIIVNHALLLADIVTGNRVIPEYGYLIVDEAHHLESATTHGLSMRVTEGELNRTLRELGNPQSGLLGRVLATARKELPKAVHEQVEALITATDAQARQCAELTKRLFNAFSEFLERQREGQPLSPYGHQVRIVPATRTLPGWDEVEIVWDELTQPIDSVVQELSSLVDSLNGLVEGGLDEAEDLAVAARGVLRRLQESVTQLNEMIFDPIPNTVYWMDVSLRTDRIALNAAPLEVGPLVERYLWNEKQAVIMTSATLTTGGSFDYLRHRLNAFDVDEIALGSPFDYETSTLLYLVNDIPEPTDREAYQRGVERGLVKLCRATGGRTLVLFTSRDQLYRTAHAIREPLSAHGVDVFAQGQGASRHALLENFRTAEQAVLLGTRSFWEGVDVAGEALSVLVIVRLPFDVPSDPIVAARAETFESSFDQYSVPEAILRFRQGFGRLIRTRADRGLVVSLDRRLLTKPYGRAFLDSIPTCTVRVGRLGDLPGEAVRWLGI